MKQTPLWFPFLLALTIALFGTVLFPTIRLFAFAPFLAILYNRTPFLKSLWLATLCGIIIDLLSSELRFGLYALNYCLTTALLYKQKRHFFEDKPLALCLYTALISSVSTLMQLFLAYTFGQGLPFTWKLVLTDSIAMPCIDALYAYVWFSGLMWVYSYVQKTGWRALWQRVRGYLRSPEME